MHHILSDDNQFEQWKMKFQLQISFTIAETFSQSIRRGCKCWFDVTKEADNAMTCWVGVKIFFSWTSNLKVFI